MEDNIIVKDFQYDEKLNSFSYMTIMTIQRYLQLVDDSGENLEIQRKIISIKRSKIYSRLVEDLKIGCIIPPVVLVIRIIPDDIKRDMENKTITNSKIESFLSHVNASKVSILDGLQRTNCLRKAREELSTNPLMLDKFLKRKLRVEFWMNMEFQAILYRMITLNAGQTTMSMKHQLEILNINLMESLQQIRQDIDIIPTNVNRRRTRPKQYKFSQLIEGYLAFIRKEPSIDVRNEVIDELNRIDFLDSYDNTKSTNGLSEYLNGIVDLDELLSAKYYQIISDDNINDDDGCQIVKGCQIFSKSTFFIGFCAALGRAFAGLGEEKFIERMDYLRRIMQENNDISPDPLQLEIYFKILNRIPKSSKIGEIERNFIFDAFTNFFLTSTDFEDSWKIAGSKVRL